MKRQRILLVAYQCASGMGSVSQIGWEWYSRLCESHDVTLVTHPRNHEALAKAGAPLAGSEIIEIDTEWFAGPLYRLAKRIFPRSEHSVFLVSSLDYFVFDRAAHQLLRQRLRDGASWDVLHRVTPVTLAAPTWLGRLGLPTVIGPLNSGLTDPPGFSAVLRQESTWLVRVREFGRLFDGIIGSSRRATRILTATRATLSGVPKKYRGRCLSMVENGVNLDRFSATDWPDAPSRNNPLRVLFVGRLIPAKALSLLLEALALLVSQGCAVRLAVVGDGPLRQQWDEESRVLGLLDVVSFQGNLPAAAVALEMQRAHVFCLPSVRESGGAVLLEAMASARPAIAMNFGGPAELIDEKVGHLIDLTSPAAVVKELAATLQDVIDHPQDWMARGRAGRHRVEAGHSWPAKIHRAEKIYDEIICEGQGT
ncbi:glycosyltransferase family 4 protein [Propionivibrio sp.]|uniref:glycosyltransferase family 4 protein n=1 Tax=Propionivibrio sp. TaxID=2212460 RepID=UPI003BF36363